jgi:CheY-like chemotaxis protein
MPESVMVVEDEGLVALELQECLRQMGYNVPAVAVTGVEAVARAAELRPDLVLMDIRLKGEMDGIEAARQIMDCQSIPVVYLTAHSDDATVRRARETAPFGYVLKPWEEKSLQIAIDMALHKARAEAGIKG